MLSFGCRLNAYETAAIAQMAYAQHDAIIVNTCAVTAEAEQQARKAIRRAHREAPGAPIIVTGCAAQIDPAGWAALPGVTRVVGNAEKLRAESWALDAVPSPVADIMAARETAAHLVTDFPGRARAFLQVQQGCDHRCTFCVIPYGRGPSRSVPIGVIAEHLRALVAEGFSEVVLTGVDITSYGPDLPGRPSLGQMVRRLLALVPGLPRLRLSSLDPAAIDDDLWRLIGDEARLMPHLHLSLQHGADLILKRMKRRHSRADSLAAIARARALRPEMVFGADLIAGFPTESEQAALNTLALLDDCEVVAAHIFPFSPRPGTPAARMPQVEREIVKARAARLRDRAAVRRVAWLDSLIGSGQRVLVENERGDGHGASNAPVRLSGAAKGSIHNATITARDGNRLIGTIE